MHTFLGPRRGAQEGSTFRAPRRPDSDPGASGSTPHDEVSDDGDDRCDQQQVDGEDGDVEGEEAQQPQDDEYTSDDQQDHDDLLSRVRRSPQPGSTRYAGSHAYMLTTAYQPMPR